MTTTTKKATVKKVATKAATKKAVTKKTTAKKVAQKRVLVRADDARSFWVCDGQILNSLEALHAVLGKMEKSVFTHHVNKDKNDFAEWVDAVLMDSACAADLRKAKSASGAKTVVAKYLKLYLV
jgi:hypothetical protein